jgi:hypothetical protein
VALGSESALAKIAVTRSRLTGEENGIANNIVRIWYLCVKAGKQNAI